MARIVVNKHVDEKSSVTIEKFQNDGEIVISNEVGNEGIFIRNKENSPIFISANINIPKHVVLTQNEYDTIKNGGIIEGKEDIIYDENTYYAIIEE